jgi:hypothetical protein
MLLLSDQEISLRIYLLSWFSGQPSHLYLGSPVINSMLNLHLNKSPPSTFINIPSPAPLYLHHFPKYAQYIPAHSFTYTTVPTSLSKVCPVHSSTFLRLHLCPKSVQYVPAYSCTYTTVPTPLYKVPPVHSNTFLHLHPCPKAYYYIPGHFFAYTPVQSPTSTWKHLQPAVLLYSRSYVIIKCMAIGKKELSRITPALWIGPCICSSFILKMSPAEF